MVCRLITIIIQTTENLTICIGKDYFIIKLHLTWTNIGENTETEENESVKFLSLNTGEWLVFARNIFLKTSVIEIPKCKDKSLYNSDY